MTDFATQQEIKLQNALDGMRGTFHLSGQHASAGPFRVNRTASYVDSRGVPQIVIQSQLEDGRWTDYMRHDAAYFLAHYMGRVSQETTDNGTGVFDFETACTRCGFELPEDPQCSWEDVVCPCCNQIN